MSDTESNTGPGNARHPLVGPVSGAALALLTADVVRHGYLTGLEHDRLPPPPRFVGPWPVVTDLGDHPALMAMTAAATLIARARHRSPLRPLAVVAAGTGLRYLVMRTVSRPRPPSDRWLATPEGASYPSRHATAAALGLLAIRRELPPSAALNATVLGLIGLECWTRVRLGVHWPTDVLGGVLLALAVDALAPDLSREPAATR